MLGLPLERTGTRWLDHRISPTSYRTGSRLGEYFISVFEARLVNSYERTRYLVYYLILADIDLRR